MVSKPTKAEFRSSTLECDAIYGEIRRGTPLPTIAERRGVSVARIRQMTREGERNAAVRAKYGPRFDWRALPIFDCIDLDARVRNALIRSGHYELMGEVAVDLDNGELSRLRIDGLGKNGRAQLEGWLTWIRSRDIKSTPRPRRLVALTRRPASSTPKDMIPPAVLRLRESRARNAKLQAEIDARTLVEAKRRERAEASQALREARREIQVERNQADISRAVDEMRDALNRNLFRKRGELLEIDRRSLHSRGFYGGLLVIVLSIYGEYGLWRWLSVRELPHDFAIYVGFILFAGIWTLWVWPILGPVYNRGCDRGAALAEIATIEAKQAALINQTYVARKSQLRRYDGGSSYVIEFPPGVKSICTQMKWQ